jgi:hypothetical protein
MKGITKYSGVDFVKNTPLFDFAKEQAEGSQDAEDRHIRFTIGGEGARRLTETDFLEHLRNLDPKQRNKVLENSDAPEAMKALARKDADESLPGTERIFKSKDAQLAKGSDEAVAKAGIMASARGADVRDDLPSNYSSANTSRNVSPHAQPRAKAGANREQGETAAERRRRQAVMSELRDDEAGATVSPAHETPADIRRRQAMQAGKPSGAARDDEEAVHGEETAVERRRRIAALGTSADSDGEGEATSKGRGQTLSPPALTSESSSASGRQRGIRFAEDPRKGRK